MINDDFFRNKDKLQAENMTFDLYRAMMSQ